MARGNRPEGPLDAQAVRDVRVLVHELIVIKGDELVADRLAEYQRHRQKQEAADGQHLESAPRPSSCDRQHTIGADARVPPGPLAASLGNRLTSLRKTVFGGWSTRVLFSAHATEGSHRTLLREIVGWP